MTSINERLGGMLAAPTSVLWSSRSMDHFMDMPYRTGKPHIYLRNGAWRIADKSWTWTASSFAELLEEWCQ